MNWPNVEAQLKQTSDEAEKWRLLTTFVAAVGPMFADKPDLSVEEQLREQLVYLHIMSEFLLDYYPEIVRRLPLRVIDLPRLAKVVESDYRPVWEEERDDIRAYVTLRRGTEGVLAKDWLETLTGKTFASREEFDTWLREYRDSLRWNPALGRFEYGEGDCGSGEKRQ